MAADDWQNGYPDEPFDEDAEGPQACDLSDDSEYDTVACPACGGDISELAERCPRCGEWIVPGARPSGRRRLVVAVIAAVLIALLLIWLL
jgi:DNA-directed RNA polymerase subunit RPC12/RpoP